MTQKLDIKSNSEISSFVDEESLEKWQSEDKMLHDIEDECLAMLFILKGKYAETPEYSLIKSNMNEIINKVSLLRVKLVHAEETVIEKSIPGVDTES